MKNLYERLKPEFKEALEKHAEQYPITVQEVVGDLKNKHYIPAVMYGTYLQLETISLMCELPRKESFFDYFND